MINQRSLQAIAQAEVARGFLKPLYESYCFSQIPNTILYLLGCSSQGGLPDDCTTPGPYERVLLFIIDGFGWKFLEKYKDRYPFLKRFYEEGIVSKLTSQFPSTTAAHITTFCSNQLVGEHGIYEWFIYEPQLERVVAPLLYTFAGDKTRGSIEDVLKPADFLPEGFFLQELQKNNMPATIFLHESILDSVYSKWMFKEARRVGYKNWSEALTSLKNSLSSPGFFYLYFGDFDREAHHHGLASSEVEKALDRCFHELEAILMKADFPKSTALLITADHGMIDIHPSTTLYLNKKFSTLERKLKKGMNGSVLSPAGSCRDFFLHVEPMYLDEVFEELKQELANVAWVTLTADLIDQGFFGPEGVSPQCKKRMGDIVIIAQKSHSFWWYEEGKFEQNLYAMHGGLTPDELETMLLFLQPK